MSKGEVYSTSVHLWWDFEKVINDIKVHIGICMCLRVVYTFRGDLIKEFIIKMYYSIIVSAALLHLLFTPPHPTWYTPDFNQQIDQEKKERKK